MTTRSRKIIFNNCAITYVSLISGSLKGKLEAKLKSQDLAASVSQFPEVEQICIYNRYLKYVTPLHGS